MKSSRSRRELNQETLAGAFVPRLRQSAEIQPSSDPSGSTAGCVPKRLREDGPSALDRAARGEAAVLGLVAGRDVASHGGLRLVAHQLLGNASFFRRDVGCPAGVEGEPQPQAEEGDVFKAVAVPHEVPRVVHRASPDGPARNRYASAETCGTVEGVNGPACSGASTAGVGWSPRDSALIDTDAEIDPFMAFWASLSGTAHR